MNAYHWQGLVDGDRRPAVSVFYTFDVRDIALLLGLSRSNVSRDYLSDAVQRVRLESYHSKPRRPYSRLWQSTYCTHTMTLKITPSLLNKKAVSDASKKLHERMCRLPFDVGDPDNIATAEQPPPVKGASTITVTAP